MYSLFFLSYKENYFRILSELSLYLHIFLHTQKIFFAFTLFLSYKENSFRILLELSLYLQLFFHTQKIFFVFALFLLCKENPFRILLELSLYLQLFFHTQKIFFVSAFFYKHLVRFFRVNKNRSSNFENLFKSLSILCFYFLINLISSHLRFCLVLIFQAICSRL